MINEVKSVVTNLYKYKKNLKSSFGLILEQNRCAPQ